MYYIYNILIIILISKPIIIFLISYTIYTYLIIIIIYLIYNIIYNIPLYIYILFINKDFRTNIYAVYIRYLSLLYILLYNPPLISNKQTTVKQ